MISKLEVWDFILKNVQQSIPVVLLYVLESKGSSPGRQGFLMAVNAKAEMIGSIGGGIMEHKFVEMGKEMLKNISQGIKIENGGALRKQMHDKSASRDQSGMICSGEQTIFIYQVQSQDVYSIEKIVQAIIEKKEAKLRLNKAGIEFVQEPAQHQFHFQMNSEDDWSYEEKIGEQPHIHIIGGGHCALALSKIMNMLGFFVHVYDDRPLLNTMQQNHFADERKQLNSYNDLAMLLDNTKEDYVVIMTFGYRTDDMALRAIINKPFKYLGLLGSKAKIEKMFNDCKAEGWTEEQLQSIHAPVGLDIKSETPAEIAISIAAEIIKLKNNADQDS